jgi:diguanylate cyclase (GGDEF)-like protein
MIKYVPRRTAGTANTPRTTGQVLRFRGTPLAQAINFDDSPAGPKPAPPTIAAEDWSDLFNAVQERLTQAVNAQAGAGTDASPATQAHLQTVVRECVEALQQLHEAQKHTRVQSQHMALDMFDTRTTLAQLRAELSGTQAREQQARHQAQHDGLTQLPNRDHFGARLQQAISDPQALAVMFIDLDGFKPINDIHGHATGDELLKIISARLAQSVRSSDLVARLGGDEFACLVTGLSNHEQLSHFARKLFDHVAEPIQIGPLRLSMRPSIGIAMRQALDTSAATLLNEADTAMYLAKREKTGHAFFNAA